MAVLSPFTNDPFDAGLTNFFSAAPDHGYQARLLAVMLARYGWTKIGILHTPEPESISCTYCACLDLLVNEAAKPGTVVFVLGVAAPKGRAATGLFGFELSPLPAHVTLCRLLHGLSA